MDTAPEVREVLKQHLAVHVHCRLGMSSDRTVRFSVRRLRSAAARNRIQIAATASDPDSSHRSTPAALCKKAGHALAPWLAATAFVSQARLHRVDRLISSGGHSKPYGCFHVRSADSAAYASHRSLAQQEPHDGRGPSASTLQGPPRGPGRTTQQITCSVSDEQHCVGAT